MRDAAGKADCLRLADALLVVRKQFFDYASGIPFQSVEDKPQPGSLDAEAGIMASTFDRTGTRLLTGCCDKSIKVWKEAE